MDALRKWICNSIYAVYRDEKVKYDKYEDKR